MSMWTIFARGEARQVPRHAVVEARAHRDQAVALLHRVVGVGTAVHAEHVQRLGVVLVERAQPQQRRRARDVGLAGRLRAPATRR